MTNNPRSYRPVSGFVLPRFAGIATFMRQLRRPRRHAVQSQRPERLRCAHRAVLRRGAQGGVVPLSPGGDHLITLPIMRAIAKDRPVGVMHFDAHTDTNDRYSGEHKLTHETAFRRAI